MRKRAGAGIGAGVLVLSVMLAGCGGDDGADDADRGSDQGGETGVSAEEFAQLEWPEVRTLVQQDMESLESVHVSMKVRDDGDDTEADVSMSTRGSCEGTLTLDGATVELLQADGEMWFRAEPAFWEQNAPERADQFVAAVGDRWIVDDDEFEEFCDLSGFLDSLIADDDDPTSDHRISEPEEIDGEQVVTIDYQAEGQPVSAVVRAEGPHYLVSIDRSGDEDTGTIEFTGYDEEVRTEAPAEDQTVNLDELDG